MPRAKVLNQSFFDRPTLDVTRDLLGKTICRKMPDGKVVRLILNEIEAYDGFDDKACHASRGKTPRNDVMFGPAGRWYVYLCYGVHWMVNIVTGPPEYPAAVLIRGAGEVVGPGRLTKALSIDKALNGEPSKRASGLWIEDSGLQVEESRVQRTARIGIDYAGDWVNKPYRYLLND